MRLLLITICILLGLNLARGEAESGEAIPLKPYRVTAGLFDLACRVDKASGRMLEAKASWVAPMIKKQGLHVGDSLTVINGKPLADFLYSDFNVLLDAGVEPGQQHVFTFVGTRWHFSKKKIELTVTAPEPKRPNQALQHNDPSCHVPCLRTYRASRGRG